uniref:Uncharacterized protein n=1 Tax=Panagrolaimus sp. ES5 TaxID=591445 RepID=A0AC34F425_9BILA
MYRHPGPRSYGGGGRIQKKIPSGHSVFYPYETPPADVEVKEFPISTSNFEFFHGYNNMFTLQFWTDISIDDIVYKSVDHYYQKMKVFDLTGSASEKFDDPKVKNYSGVAREVLRENNISRKTVDEWRTSCGVEVIQKALLEKFPIAFPLTTKTAKNVPSVAKGRNMLGAIYIALREQVKSGNLNDLSVSLTPVDQTVKIKKTAPRPIPTAPMTRIIPPPQNQISGSNAIPLRNVVPLREVGIHPAAAGAPSNGYAGYTAGQPPLMYTAEQQQQFQNNRPSLASQLPEVPVAPDLRYFNNPAIQNAASTQSQRQQPIPSTDQMYANYQSQQMQFQQQQQQHAQQQKQPTYASLAAQNQDFSMDVDNISGQHANTQVTRQVFQPPGAGNQSMYQGQYDWQW